MATDLHGMTIHNAWKEYRRATSDCYVKGVKKIVIITGHGIMAKEFLGWVDADPHAKNCERQNPNTGAWTVHLHKKPHIPPKSTEYTQLDLTGLYKKFNK